MALGPTVKPIPDVYIGPAAAVGAQAEEGTFTFRYSNALTLWDHVTVGVEAGDGSTSDTLYWAWAAKAAELSGGTGDFLESASVNYTIIQENAVEAKLLNQPPAVGAEGWVEGINAALVDGGGLEEISLAAAGMLTFRNIALSPLPEDASYPDPGAGVAGVLDVQEATVFVSDKSTTPGTASFLLVTTDATFVSDDGTGIDFLSGAPVFNFDLVEDYTADVDVFGTFRLSDHTADSKIGATVDPAQVTVSKVGGTISMGSPITNQVGRWYFAQASTPISVDPANLYRVSTVLGSSNTAASANPTVVVGLNDRGKSGYGYYELGPGSPAGPTATAPVALTGYMAPVMASDNAGVYLRIFDDSDVLGGTISFSAIKVASIPMSEVLAAADVKATVESFDRAQWPELAAGGVAFPGYNRPTFTVTPASGTAGQVTLTGTTNTHSPSPIQTNQQGFTGLQGPEFVSSTVGKLVLVAATLSTNASDAANIPMTWLNVIEDGIGQPNLIIGRDTAATSGPSTTPRVYYVAYEALKSSAFVNFRIWADTSQVTGGITLSEVKVLELDVPTSP